MTGERDELDWGYFGKMYRWLEDFTERGVQAGKFTRRQAQQDLQIALWYSYACNNLDEYRYYYKAAQWMKQSEKNAAGCATWYYRYSVALMYCGQLEEARSYAERGIQEEPEYPWIWLQAGRLRAHFGDKAGALDAVKHGLTLEPGDHEFLTLKKEIKAGATLEQMEYHWIPTPTGRSSKGWTRTPTISSAPSPASPSIRRGWSAFGASSAPSRSSTHPTHLTRSSHIW